MSCSVYLRSSERMRKLGQDGRALSRCLFEHRHTTTVLAFYDCTVVTPSIRQPLGYCVLRHQSRNGTAILAPVILHGSRLGRGDRSSGAAALLVTTPAQPRPKILTLLGLQPQRHSYNGVLLTPVALNFEGPSKATTVFRHSSRNLDNGFVVKRRHSNSRNGTASLQWVLSTPVASAKLLRARQRLRLCFDTLVET
jgi:hypothetical protein